MLCADCYSPNRKKPLEKRSFTDCICFIGFLGFLFGWFMLAWWGMFNYLLYYIITLNRDLLGVLCNYIIYITLIRSFYTLVIQHNLQNSELLSRSAQFMANKTFAIGLCFRVQCRHRHLKSI